MKTTILLLVLLLFTACSGGKNSEVNERELYGQKRADCKTTKMTDQGANVMQCSEIRADDKEIRDSSDTWREEYSPENYGPSSYQKIQK
ncbi:MAG: hypothetical protein WBB48_03040 [Thermodesulfobacteriota bacterium]